MAELIPLPRTLITIPGTVVLHIRAVPPFTLVILKPDGTSDTYSLPQEDTPIMRLRPGFYALIYTPTQVGVYKYTLTAGQEVIRGAFEAIS